MPEKWTNKGDMTTRQAGGMGGKRTSETHGHQFYEDIGKKGGQKVRELVEKGKQMERGKK